MTEKLCSEGHVIEESAEKCSRCGGAPVNQVELSAQSQENTMTEENNEEKDVAASTDEQSTEQAAPAAEGEAKEEGSAAEGAGEQSENTDSDK